MPVKKVQKVRKAAKVQKVHESKGQALARVLTRPRPGLGKAKSAIKAKTRKTVHTKETSSAVAKKPPSTRTGLTADVYNISGKKEGTITLAKEIFGAKINKKLLAQALHIYFVNSSAHHGSTKTRSEVRGGGAKPWRQKGTGRARAGSRRSPLWVGGAKALGPKPRKTVLTLPKKMKRQSLISALSAKAQNSEVKVVSSFEKIPPKTKIVANFLQKTQQKGSTLFVISAKNNNVILATRNLQKVLLNTADGLNTYEVVKNQNLIFTKEALQSLTDRFSKKVEKSEPKT